MIKLIALSILLFIAVIPVFIMLLYIYFTDKVDREPLWLILLLLFLGGLSVISALIVEILGGAVISLIFDVGLGELLPGMDFSVIVAFLECFFVVAIAEELGKFVMVLIPTWKNKHYNYRFDGVVYCVSAGLGFALIENILYILPEPAFATIQGGLGLMLQTEVWEKIGAGFGVGIMRAMTSIPGHTMFGIFMGVFYGYAKYYASQKKKGKTFVCFLLALIVPIILHGLYDYFLTVGSILTILSFLEFIVLAYILAFVITRVEAKHDKAFTVPFTPLQKLEEDMNSYQAQRVQNYQTQNEQNGSEMYDNPEEYDEET